MTKIDLTPGDEEEGDGDGEHSDCTIIKAPQLPDGSKANIGAFGLRHRRFSMEPYCKDCEVFLDDD